MMPILVISDDARSGRKAKVRHGWLRAAQESMCFKRPTKKSSTFQRNEVPNSRTFQDNRNTKIQGFVKIV